MRTINNNCGHEKGDEYIRTFAQLLRKSVPESCFVGRNGGDEFLAVLRGMNHVGVRECMRELRRQSFHFSDCIYCDALLDQYRMLRASSDFFLAEDGSYSGAVEQIAQELATTDNWQELWEKLQLSSLKQALGADHQKLELPFSYDDGNGIRRGRLTALFHDETADGRLHHFILGLEEFHDSAASRPDEKQQLIRYYDQLKQSVVENSNYVDALMDSAHKLLERFDAGAKQVTVEYQEKSDNGQLIWLQKTVLMSRNIFYNNETKQESVVIRGIILFENTSAFHEKEEREKERLQEAYETVDTASKAKTEFLHRLSHNVRTLINGVLGMLEIIRQNRDDEQKVDECLDKMRVSANHLLDLVNDVLDMSKIESGHGTEEQEAFSLPELMDEKRQVIQPVFSFLKGIRFHVNSVDFLKKSV